MKQAQQPGKHGKHLKLVWKRFTQSSTCETKTRKRHVCNHGSPTTAMNDDSFQLEVEATAVVLGLKLTFKLFQCHGNQIIYHFNIITTVT